MVGTVCDTSVLYAPAGELVFRVRGPSRQGQLVRVRSPKCTIGSGPQCTLRLRAPGVRAVHCLILRGRATTLVRRWAPDTRLNGRAFQDQALEPGDLLSIGPVELEVVSLGPPMGEEAPAHARSTHPSEGQALAPVVRQQAELARQQAELHRRESQCRAKEQLIADQAERIESERAALAAEAKRLQVKAAQLDAGRRELEDERAAWERRHAETQVQSAQQADADEQREAEFEHVRAELQQARDELQRRRREWQSEQDARTHQLDQLARQLDSHQEQLDQREEQLAQRVQAVEQQSRELDARRKEIDRQEQLLKEQQQAADARAAELDALSQQLDQRQEQLDQREKQLDSRQEQLDQRQEQLDQLAEQLQSRRREIDTKEAALDCQDAAQAEPPAAAQPKDGLALRPAEPAGDHAAQSDDEPAGHTPETPADEEQPMGGQIAGKQPAGEQELAFEEPSKQAPVELSAVLRRMGAAPLVPDDEPDASSAPAPEAPISRPTVSAPHAASQESPADDTGEADDQGTEDAEEAESGSIDLYMAGLLQRARGRNERHSPSQGEVGAGSDEPGTERGAAPRWGRKLKERVWTRPTAPEKETGLSAMRQLASQAAQAAIGSHARRQVIRARWTKLLVAITGLVVGGVLLGMWKAGSANTVAYYGGLVGLLVAVVWGIQYAVLCGRLIVNHFGSLDLNRPARGGGDSAGSAPGAPASADPAIEAPGVQASAAAPDAAVAETVPDPQAAAFSNPRPEAHT